MLKLKKGYMTKKRILFFVVIAGLFFAAPYVGFFYKDISIRNTMNNVADEIIDTGGFRTSSERREAGDISCVSGCTNISFSVDESRSLEEIRIILEKKYGDLEIEEQLVRNSDGSFSEFIEIKESSEIFSKVIRVDDRTLISVRYEK